MSEIIAENGSSGDGTGVTTETPFNRTVIISEIHVKYLKLFQFIQQT